MSSSAFLSLFSDDVLTKTQMKPWWERIRGHVSFVALGIALFIVYEATAAEAVHCIPVNGTLSLTYAETDFANAYCSSNLLWWVRHFPYINFVLCTAAFFTYTVWLMIPRVRSTFESLRQCDEILTEHKLTAQEIEEAIIAICTSDRHPGSKLAVSEEVASTLASTFFGLWTSETAFPISVRTIYVLRNFFASVPIAASLVLSVLTIDEINSQFISCTVPVKYQTEMSCYHILQQKIIGPLYTLAIFQAVLILSNVLISVSVFLCTGKKKRESTDDGKLSSYESHDTHAHNITDGMSRKESDNRFALLFADSSKSIHYRTRHLLFPKDIDGLTSPTESLAILVMKLKSKTFSHKKEELFSSTYNILKNGLKQTDFKEFRDCHRVLLYDEWALEKLKIQPNYCGCKEYFQTHYVFDKKEADETLWESLFDRSNEESHSNLLLSEADDELGKRESESDVDLMLHILEFSVAGRSRTKTYADFWEHFITLCNRSKRLLKEFISKISRKDCKQLTQQRSLEQMRKICRADFENNDFRSFLVTHFLIFVVRGDKEWEGKNCDCDCDQLLPKHDLSKLDESGKSLLYYLLSEVKNFRITYIEHILKKLSQPTALRVDEVVFVKRNESATFLKYMESRYSDDSFFTDLREVFDRCTKEKHMPEIKRICRKPLKSVEDYRRFALFHAEACSSKISKKGKCFCRDALMPLPYEERIEILGLIYNTELFDEENAQKKDKLGRHIALNFGWKIVEMPDWHRVNFMDDTGKSMCCIDTKSNKLMTYETNGSTQVVLPMKEVAEISLVTRTSKGWKSVSKFAARDRRLIFTNGNFNLVANGGIGLPNDLKHLRRRNDAST